MRVGGGDGGILRECLKHPRAAVLAGDGVGVDSDILVPGRSASSLPRDPCDPNPLDLARSRHPFAGAECCLTKVPLYPGGYFAFLLHRLGDRSCRQPVREHRSRHYNPGIHSAAFALPTWWRRLLDRKT